MKTFVVLGFENGEGTAFIVKTDNTDSAISLVACIPNVVWCFVFSLADWESIGEEIKSSVEPLLTPNNVVRLTPKQLRVEE